jgi:hypothetical protein
LDEEVIEMTLRECYIEHSYYYPKLEHEMNRIAQKEGLNGLASEAIIAFCNGTFGQLRLDNIEDYESILGVFRCFVTGTAWALQHVHA